MTVPMHYLLTTKDDLFNQDRYFLQRYLFFAALTSRNMQLQKLFFLNSKTASQFKFCPEAPNQHVIMPKYSCKNNNQVHEIFF